MTYKVLKARLLAGLCYGAFGIVAAIWACLSIVAVVIDLLREGAAELQCWLFSHVEENAAIAGEETPRSHERRRKLQRMARSSEGGECAGAASVGWS